MTALRPIAALLAALCLSCASAYRDAIPVEIVDVREGWTTTGDRVVELTILYREPTGASMTTRVYLPVEVYRLRLHGRELCVVPSPQGRRLIVCP